MVISRKHDLLLKASYLYAAYILDSIAKSCAYYNGFIHSFVS